MIKLANFILAYTPKKLIHGASIILGFLILNNYVPESLCLLAIFAIASYIYLQLPKKYRNGIGVFIPSIFLILYWYSLSTNSIEKYMNDKQKKKKKKK